MSEDKKNITFFIVNNQNGEMKKLIIPFSKLKIASFLLAIFLIVLTAGIIDYVGLMGLSIENTRLKAENSILITQFQVIETKVSSLEDALEKVKTFTTKLKLITNTEDNDRLTKLTVQENKKSESPMEDFEPMEKRQTNEQMLRDDQLFSGSDLAKTEKGELAIAKSDQDYASLVIRIDNAVRDSHLKEQSVLELWETLSERQSLLNSTPNIKPARGWLSSGFGYRVNPVTGKKALHAGLDIAASPGAPVYAPADGVVGFASYDDTYGKIISLDHGYGITTRFGHLSQIYVHIGQRVNKWDVIGAVGNTGRSTGPHLHYEVRLHEVPIDPINYILED